MYRKIGSKGFQITLQNRTMTVTPFKLAVSAFLLGPTIYFAQLLIRALTSDVSLGQGFKSILSNAWATSALVDYVTAMPFVFAYVTARSKTTLAAIATCSACFFLGNVVTVPLFVFYILVSPGTWMIDALLPLANPLDSHAGPSVNGSPYIKPVLVAFTSVTLIFYTAICIRAIASGDPGFSFILNDVWSKVTFVDVLVGIQVVVLFVIVKEGALGRRWGATVLWVLGLLLLGNGVTCLYVLWLVSNVSPLAGGSGVLDVFLGKAETRGFVEI
ncbi:hypothetical protein BJ741DRAFT_577666 [Chytriomyces cf. hyalinus JEL632]|nr:hypothetical protein BJ741DRAFT_577666 [Chytriomyces cf. hyalinus JEL632]